MPKLSFPVDVSCVVRIARELRFRRLLPGSTLARLRPLARFPVNIITAARSSLCKKYQEEQTDKARPSSFKPADMVGISPAKDAEVKPLASDGGDPGATLAATYSDPVIVFSCSKTRGQDERSGCRRCPSKCIPKRYIFSILGFAACSLAVNFNTNLSITIVSMVNRNESLSDIRNSNECLPIETPEMSAKELVDVNPAYKPGEFVWSTETEGLAIGAAYYGQLVGFIPGGRLAELYGGKSVLIGSIFFASVFTMLLPLAAYWSVHCFILCRFLIGVGTAPAIPVLFYLIAKWIPLTERSFHASVILAGYGVGSFAGFIVGGFLCGSDFLDGWPSVFYTGGLAGLLWCFLCYFLVSESPADHPSISREELRYILKNLPTKEQKKIAKIPWKEMVLSLPLWALAIGYFGQFWILGFFCTAHALYMGTILNLDIVRNGQLSCLPHLIRALFACVCSFPADYALKRGYVSPGFIRKGASALNTVVSCAGFVGILLVGCDPFMNTVFFTVGGLLGDFVTFGVCMACIDIAPDLAGTVSGILNIIGVIPFFLIPSIVGWVTMYERNMTQWSYVFFCTIGVALVTTLVYIVFGTSEVQPWGTNCSPEYEAPREKAVEDDGGEESTST